MALSEIIRLMEDNCMEEKCPETISYVIHEATIARMQSEIDRMEARNKEERERDERKFNRMMIAIVFSVALIFMSNVGWLIYESLYDTITYDQDGEGVNNINTGKQGDVIREPEVKNQETEKR